MTTITPLGPTGKTRFNIGLSFAGSSISTLLVSLDLLALSAKQAPALPSAGAIEVAVSRRVKGADRIVSDNEALIEVYLKNEKFPVTVEDHPGMHEIMESRLKFAFLRDIPGTWVRIRMRSSKDQKVIKLRLAGKPLEARKIGQLAGPFGGVSVFTNSEDFGGFLGTCPRVSRARYDISAPRYLDRADLTTFSGQCQLEDHILLRSGKVACVRVTAAHGKRTGR